MSTSSSNNVAPTRKTRHVGIDPATAFGLFTLRLDEWWPMTAHSVSGQDAATVRFATSPGGAVVEIAPDGTESVWAAVLVHDPPDRVVLAWHPGAEPRPASQLDVRFRPAAPAAASDAATPGATAIAMTELVLVHSGWERYGARGADLRRGYHVGGTPCSSASSAPRPPALRCRSAGRQASLKTSGGLAKHGVPTIDSPCLGYSCSQRDHSPDPPCECWTACCARARRRPNARRCRNAAGRSFGKLLVVDGLV